MGTFVDDGNMMLNMKSKSSEPEQNSHSEDNLIKKLGNIVLKADEHDMDNHAKKDLGTTDGTALQALQSYAGDCPHFIRTGRCKFGLNCRYNHPEKWTKAAIDVEKDVISEERGQIECKYYQTAEGCRYGNSCRFRHCGEYSQNKVQELNFLGLPIRSGEKDCVFYMHNGTCQYGSRCVFNHPDPTPVSPTSSNDKLGRELSHPFGKQNGDSLPNHFSGASQPDQASWSSHILSDNPTSYLSSRSTYVTLPSPPQQMQKQSEWNRYQGPISHPSGHFSATPSGYGSLRETFLSTKDDEFPERPGLPECDYYMRTGNCKFRSACRYHHPKDRKSKGDNYVLSEKGLPLRPGRSICRHYQTSGLCKFGGACLFDHPVTDGFSAYPDWLASRTVVDSDAGSWDE